MKAKIVKLKCGEYALRRGIFEKEYADINDLKNNREIYWWTSNWPEYFKIKNLDELRNLVENYVQPVKPKERVLETVKLK